MESGDRGATPRLVFLDTEVFIRPNFQYRQGLLAAFAQQVAANRVIHIITDVTVEELHAGLTDAVEGASIALRQFRKDARILRNSRSPQMGRAFRKLNRRTTLRDLTSQLASFVDELSSEIVQINQVWGASTSSN